MGTTEAGTNSINDITPVLNKETGRRRHKRTEIRSAKADDKQIDELRADIVTTVDDGRAVVANIAGTATDTDGTTHAFRAATTSASSATATTARPHHRRHRQPQHRHLLDQHRQPRRLDRHPRLHPLTTPHSTATRHDKGRPPRGRPFVVFHLHPASVAKQAGAKPKPRAAPGA